MVRLFPLSLISTLILLAGCMSFSNDALEVERLKNENQNLRDALESITISEPPARDLRGFLADLFHDKNTALWECIFPPTGGQEWIGMKEEVPSSDLSTVIEKLNTNFSETNQPLLQLTKVEEDTAVVGVSNESLLVNGMGTTGAYCYLAAVTFSLTSVDDIDYVWFDIKEGSHAVPGRYSRADFSNLWPLQAFSLSASINSDELIEYTEINDEERALLSKIQSIDQDFYYVPKIRRHYIIHEETNVRIPVFSEIIFDRNNPVYLKGDYTAYSVSWEPYAFTVRVGFDKGTAYRGERVYTVLHNDVVKVERSCGVSACGVNIEHNGQNVESFNVENDYYQLHN